MKNGIFRSNDVGAKFQKTHFHNLSYNDEILPLPILNVFENKNKKVTQILKFNFESVESILENEKMLLTKHFSFF